ADRAVRRPAAASPHGAAPAAHDGGAAAPLAGRATVPPAARPAAAGPRPLGRPAAVVAAAEAAVRPTDAPAGGAAHLRRGRMGVARSAGLRPGPALRRLALLAARLFPRRGAAVLVSGRAAVSEPAALVALAAVAVPADRRPVEHGPVGRADVLRARAVPLL